jgi:hypothetical protein
MNKHRQIKYYSAFWGMFWDMREIKNGKKLKKSIKIDNFF